MRDLSAACSLQAVSKAVTVARAGRIPRSILENGQPHPPRADSTRRLALVKAYWGLRSSLWSTIPEPFMALPMLCKQPHPVTCSPHPKALAPCLLICHPQVQDTQRAIQHSCQKGNLPSSPLCFLLGRDQRVSPGWQFLSSVLMEALPISTGVGRSGCQEGGGSRRSGSLSGKKEESSVPSPL